MAFINFVNKIRRNKTLLIKVWLTLLSRPTCKSGEWPKTNDFSSVSIKTVKHSVKNTLLPCQSTTVQDSIRAGGRCFMEGWTATSPDITLGLHLVVSEWGTAQLHYPATNLVITRYETSSMILALKIGRTEYSHKNTSKCRPWALKGVTGGRQEVKRLFSRCSGHPIHTHFCVKALLLQIFIWKMPGAKVALLLSNCWLPAAICKRDHLSS